MIADAGPVRVIVFHKLGSADIVSNAAPEPMRKPATSLREFVLSLRPHVWANQSMLEGIPSEKERKDC